jgi:DNA-binding response OmpR family regulator
MTKILLIEPDRVLAANIREYFAKAGYEVIAHNDLQQAIAAADKIQPDAVILELQLAGRSGIEFLYEFRSYPDWQHLPVILHTVIKVDELMDYGRVLRDLNVAKVLYKPTAGLNTLLQVVDEQLVAVSA